MLKVEIGPMWWRVWRLLAECPVWAVVVVVADVLVQHDTQMPFTRDQHPVGALATHGADPALGDRVGRGACGGVRITSIRPR